MGMLTKVLLCAFTCSTWAAGVPWQEQNAMGVYDGHVRQPMSGSKGKPWNGENIPFAVASGTLGWNPTHDVVGAGVYGGIVKRDTATGRVLLGDEWPANNADWKQGPHNSVAPHSGLQSPFLDFAQFTPANRGYAHISNLVTRGDSSAVRQLFSSLGADKSLRAKLANLVMAGGARPLHMCGMTRGGDPAEIVRILVAEGADPNALDNYAMTPLDRMLSNRVAAGELRKLGGTKRGPVDGAAVPAWDSEAFAYSGKVGESANAVM